jgi:hypothetical protein
MPLKNLLKAMHTEMGKYAISFVLGIGLASLFRKVCKGRNCLVFEAPPFEEITKNVYVHDGKCYSFKEKSVKCGSAERQVTFGNEEVKT